MICLIKSQKVNNILLGLFAKAMIPPFRIPKASVWRATTLPSVTPPALCARRAATALWAPPPPPPAPQ